ncbi:acyl-CoA transferase [Roseomonas genomospecies 6]|nr:acyl-CoA transferase [Roseomonas genomospecies 6]
MQAIVAALGAIGAKVIRNAEVPTTVPAEGLVILRDGDPGEAVEVVLSPVAYTFDHRAEIEVYAQAQAKTARAATLDDLIAAIGTALAADRTFGGLADWSAPGGPAVTDTGSTGAASVASAAIPLTVAYTVNDPLS